MTRLGLIADTHGLLRPEAVDFLRGCERILHAGDIGDPELLARLQDVAPVTAVRGNNDLGSWAESLREWETVSFGGVKILMTHAVPTLDRLPPAEGVKMAVVGHSHRPAIELHKGLTCVNPGSAGPRRFHLPISLGDLLVDQGVATVRIFTWSANGWEEFQRHVLV